MAQDSDDANELVTIPPRLVPYGEIVQFFLSSTWGRILAVRYR